MDDSTGKPTHSIGDYAFDAVYVAGIGGGLVALFFLVYDVLTGRQALYTPSLLGRMLFGGGSADVAQGVDMMAVAQYSIVHFVAFGLLGLGISFATHQAELHSRHPVLMILLVFAVLEVGFWLAASFAAPGVIEKLGPFAVAAANLIAAIGIALFLLFTHQPDLWSRLKRGL